MSTVFFLHLIKYNSRKSTYYTVLTKKTKTFNNNSELHVSSSNKE